MSTHINDARAICKDKLLDVLNHPMFMIFQIQHDQISEKVDSDNKLLLHFKNSMSNMKQWNSSVVNDFCTKLMKKFPDLRNCEILFKEMVSVTCTMMNEVISKEGRYVPANYDMNEVIHSFIVECSNIFIEHPEWFSQGPDSTEYQTCINNSKIAIKDGGVVENTVRKYITLTTLDELSSDSSSESSISEDESDTSEDMEPTPGPGLYIVNNDEDSQSEDLGEKSGDESNVNHVDDGLTKTINVETGVIEGENGLQDNDTMIPSFQERMSMHMNNGIISNSGNDTADTVTNVPGSSVSLKKLTESDSIPENRLEKEDKQHSESEVSGTEESGSEESGSESEESGSEESGSDSDESGSEESGSEYRRVGIRRVWIRRVGIRRVRIRRVWIRGVRYRRVGIRRVRIRRVWIRRVRIRRVWIRGVRIRRVWIRRVRYR